MAASADASAGNMARPDERETAAATSQILQAKDCDPRGKTTPRGQRRAMTPMTHPAMPGTAMEPGDSIWTPRI